MYRLRKWVFSMDSEKLRETTIQFLTELARQYEEDDVDETRTDTIRQAEGVCLFYDDLRGAFNLEYEPLISVWYSLMREANERRKKYYG